MVTRVSGRMHGVRARLHRRPTGVTGGGAIAAPGVRRSRIVVALVALTLALALVTVPRAEARPAAGPSVTLLSNADFAYGTYIVDKPGTYRLTEDISFNPNSPAQLTADVANGTIPGWVAGALGWPSPVDAYHSGLPLFTQFLPGGTSDFSPGGPMDAQYDPAAYGIGFFAAIAVTADDVVIDLNGHTIEQSAEHALLQRFFAVIELADQPFIPAQGPHDFGEGIDAAKRVTIKNGTIGLSSHHGIHGNGNEDITISNVSFDGYEVGAVALNGVRGLTVKNVSATNRKDVPVLGTFSSAMFIKAYIDELARNGSPTTLTVNGQVLDVYDIQAALRDSINNTHADLIANPNIVDGRAQIDPATHPVEYGVFHNRLGLLDGNSYSFLVNPFGVAVDGFPHTPADAVRSEDIVFHNVRVYDQKAFINEVPAISVGGVAAIDPVGAVFQIRNLNPLTGEPVTISSTTDYYARYTGNPVANAQAFVAKAKANGEFDGSNLSTKRVNIPANVLAWVEGARGYRTLTQAGVEYVCNGDSMFHVNKGVIAFKIDGATGVTMTGTSVSGLENLGEAGSSMCGDYSDGVSHPKSTLLGYGGAEVRGYTFAGSHDVTVMRSSASGLWSAHGSAIGFDVMTDSSEIHLYQDSISGVSAGMGGPNPPSSPTAAPRAIGFHAGAESGYVEIVRGCATDMWGVDGAYVLDEYSGYVEMTSPCN